MPARRFILYTTLAASLWAGASCLLDNAFWRSLDLDQLLAVTRQGTLALGAGITVGFGALLVYRRLPARREAGAGCGNRDAAEPEASW
jgi:membrane protein DedA with SNARE-associated domain